MALTDFAVCSNRFSGTLPSEAPRRWYYLAYLEVSDNLFQGSMPQIPSLYLTSVLFGQNVMTGSIPESIFGGTRLSEESGWFVSTGMLHEGTIPQTLSRSLSRYLWLALGHGLRGTFPSLHRRGTFQCLSIWQNSLEGELPNFRSFGLCETSTFL
eukprot:3655014-Amphidinium_carterae.1